MPDPLNISVKGNFDNSSERAPFLVVHEQTVFPFSLTPLAVDDQSEGAVDKAMKGDRLIGVLFELPEENHPLQVNGADFEPKIFLEGGKRRCAAVAAIARIVKAVTFPDGSKRLLLRGIRRVEPLRTESDSENIQWMVFGALPNQESDEKNCAAMVKTALSLFQDLVPFLPNLPDEMRAAAGTMNGAGRLADFLADTMNLSYIEKLAVFVTTSEEERIRLALELLTRELELNRLGVKIQSEVHQSMNRGQKEYFLREQLRAIKEELSEDSRNPDLVDLERRMQSLELPETVAELVKRELSRLELLPQASPEYNVSYTYIDWLLSVPYQATTKDRLDVEEARRILDEDHYGLEDVKERILEFLAVLQLNPNRSAPILCLVGPPGVGKTSLGKSIARAMNRKFVRASLGGVRDEAEIRGHRRTYVGALPGRIIQNLKKAGTSNPVFMLDEIDKLANDFRGDPASALLEVLDPAQNVAFNDHYLEIDYDLSKVFFIATANVLDTIPEPLRDRMEIIRLPGYTGYEKREIAKCYLVPRQMEEAALKKSKIRITLSAVDEVIDYYTREAGVRQLDRVIAQLCRKIARKIVEHQLPQGKIFSIKSAQVNDLLGSRKFLMDESEKTPQIGSATGMAWTSCGGTILPVEVIDMPGKGNLKLTGSLGKVMQESAEIAFSVVRAGAAHWKLKSSVFEKLDFHIHFPDGATPKDGPSAGVTLAIALLSRLTHRAVDNHYAMTGEITLRGRITAVGGIKEKVIAAHRSGILQIIMPKENEKDLEDLPEVVKNALTFHFVSTLDEAAALVLLEEA
ncbi:MAG: endopeptidase La [Victivallaceae bacterium]|nr:endopeptidase La [Victivallaceae bacterium]